jgi:hypothetical protein
MALREAGEQHHDNAGNQENFHHLTEQKHAYNLGIYDILRKGGNKTPLQVIS